VYSYKCVTRVRVDVECGKQVVEFYGRKDRPFFLGLVWWNFIQSGCGGEELVVVLEFVKNVIKNIICVGVVVLI
jgi:hypothetical protein